ncbi:MAG TPA: fibronectin type III domain-containing protein [Thermoanaerobaculia bacterium]|nr:fibronectin type III domain-containing protein [Thermoanaerobaculia bacterium]
MNRVFSTAAAALVFISLPVLASEPPAHDLTVPTTAGQTVTVEWTGLVPPGTIGVATNSCTSGVLEDHHLVNLTVPAGAYDSVQVTAAFHIEWDDGGQDLVLTVLYDDAIEIGSSDGGTPEENVVATNPPDGAYNAMACAFLASVPTTYRGRLTLTASEPSQNPPAGTGNASGPPPRFQHYAPDYPVQGFGMFGGEATVDVNTKTGSLFYLGFLETMRLRLDDRTSPGLETWELKSGTLNSLATMDPILIADPATGRVFAQQLVFGEGQSLTEYSDDDGETWQPSEGGGQRSGADHQSLGVGPYPPGLRPPTATYPNAVYYCSQDVALVYCSRSDDGGVTFGPGVPIYTLADCQGLHGHVKVAPDGTVYVPVAGCPSGLVSSTTSQPAVVVSQDAGLTWAVRKVSTSAPGSGSHGSDPSLAIAKDGTVYYSYVSSRDNHLHMVRTRSRGLSWERDVDLGALAGITGAQFPAVVAGDPGRAAVAFFGTTYTGEGVDTAPNFEGTWQLFLAATYDGGLTYHVVDATPGDPIQKGGICADGFCRNLLDFFDASMDATGRIVIGYEDGCIGGCPQGMPGTFSDQTVLARQSGGRRLLAAFDPAEPARPGSPRIKGHRTRDFALIEWPAPDSGGSPVQSYRVYRSGGTGGSGKEKRIANVPAPKRAFVDTKLDPGTTYSYRVSAVNAKGESAPGNSLALAVGTNAPTPEAACTLPGLRAAVDRVGEPEAAPLTRDVEAIFIAEPEDETAFGPNKLVFTLQLAAWAPLQAGARFRIFFYVPATGRFVRLNVSPGTSGNTYGHLDQDPVTGAHNTLFPDGQLDAVVYQPDGSIQIAIDKAKLGVVAGDKLLAVHADSLPGETGLNVTREEAGYFDYTVVGSAACR